MIIIDSNFFPTVYNPFKIFWRYINIAFSCFLNHLLRYFKIFFFKSPVFLQCVLYFIVYWLTIFYVVIRNYWNLIIVVLLRVLYVFTRTKLIEINLFILKKLFSVLNLYISKIVKLLTNFNSNIFFFSNFSFLRQFLYLQSFKFIIQRNYIDLFCRRSRWLETILFSKIILIIVIRLSGGISSFYCLLSIFSVSMMIMINMVRYAYAHICKALVILH